MHSHKDNIANRITGILWFTISVIFSNFNDAMAKYLGHHLPVTEVTFMRFLFGTVSLLPFMVFYNKSVFRTRNMSIHIIRGSLLFIAMFLWIYAISKTKLATGTLMSFTIPIFVLIMGPIFLKEKVTMKLWIASMIAMFGAFIVLNPTNMDFHHTSLLLLVSSIIFASLDILNKKYIQQEGVLTMMFYSTLITAICSSIPAMLYWVNPSSKELVVAFTLGCGSNLILFCLLKAFQNIEATLLAPFRYTELLVSGVVGYIVFAESIDIGIMIGSLIIIPSVVFVSLHNNAKADETMK